MSSQSPYAARPWLRHYDYWVQPQLTYPGRALHEILDTAFIDVPDRPATSFLGATLTFAEIKDRSDRLATALARLGLAKGERVGVMLPNCPQYVIAAFAILRHGAIVVNINPSYTAREVLTVLKGSGLRILITLDVLAPLALGVKDGTALEEVIVTSLAEYSPAAAAPPRVPGTLSIGDLLDGIDRPEVIRVHIDPEDL